MGVERTVLSCQSSTKGNPELSEPWAPAMDAGIEKQRVSGWIPFMRLVGRANLSYWKRADEARFQRLERLSNTKVGALYIRPGETERQARRRVIDAECLRLGLDPKQFKRLLDSKRKPSLGERKRKPDQGTSDSAQHARDIKPIS